MSLYIFFLFLSFLFIPPCSTLVIFNANYLCHVRNPPTNGRTCFDITIPTSLSTNNSFHESFRLPCLLLWAHLDPSPSEDEVDHEEEEDEYEDQEDHPPRRIHWEDVPSMSDTLSNRPWEEMQQGAPDDWTITRELLGIQWYTYVLAALIVFFLSSNTFLGPGWLGQQLGWEGTGTFTQVSDSLPRILDLSQKEYLLF